MYIPRTLLLEDSETSRRFIGERELSTVDLPLVLLGEPGIGKSDLTRALAVALPATRIEAGRLSRAHDPATLGLQPGAVVGGANLAIGARAPAVCIVLPIFGLAGLKRPTSDCAGLWLSASDRPPTAPVAG